MGKKTAANLIKRKVAGATSLTSTSTQIEEKTLVTNHAELALIANHAKLDKTFSRIEKANSKETQESKTCAQKGATSSNITNRTPVCTTLT